MLIYSEEVLREIDKKREICLEQKEIHENISNNLYKKHIIYGLPQIIIPIVMTFVSQIIEDEDDLRLASGIGFLTNGVCTCLHTFFNFNIISQKHERASFKYNDLVSYIDINLLKENRIRSTMLLDHIATEMKNLECYSPSTQNVCISNCCLNRN